jgi:hypothetical protein
VDEDFFAVLKAAVAWLESHDYRYAVIGGVATQYWGFPRLTLDIDIKVLIPNMDYTAVRDALRTAFPQRARPRVQANPLIVDVRVGPVVVDFLLAIPGYDEIIVTHAARRRLDGLSLWICSPEDLVIQKAVAGRAKDWQDIEGVLIEQRGKLDLAYVEDWLTQFADVLEKPEILKQYRDIQTRIAEAVDEINGE